jgi:hypothetical protein
MSANLYKTKDPGEFYHIHGSLEATKTLNMIGLDGFRPDLQVHEDIVATIEPAVQQFTVQELEVMNAHNRQAGIPAYEHKNFVKTPHVSKILDIVFGNPHHRVALAFNIAKTQILGYRKYWQALMDGGHA